MKAYYCGVLLGLLVLGMAGKVDSAEEGEDEGASNRVSFPMIVAGKDETTPIF